VSIHRPVARHERRQPRPGCIAVREPRERFHAQLHAIERVGASAAETGILTVSVRGVRRHTPRRRGGAPAPPGPGRLGRHSRRHRPDPSSAAASPVTAMKSRW
jgi:hypothetical protein